MVSVVKKMKNMLLKAEEGSVAILVALALFVLVVAAGASVDMARAQILHTRLQASLDASGLAALASLNNVPGGKKPEVWAQEQAQRYFDANFPSGYLDTPPITVTATVSADGNAVELKASTVQPTSFMTVAGINSVNVDAVSKATRASTGQGMELVLVLDNTGSMNCNVSVPTAACDGGAMTKIAALKSAANELLDIIYGAGDSTPGLYVGVVPFSQAVNIGTNHPDWMSGDPSWYYWGPKATDGWAGCVMARERSGVSWFSPSSTYANVTGLEDVSDTGPYIRPLQIYWFPPDPSLIWADHFAYDWWGGGYHYDLASSSSFAASLITFYGQATNYNPPDAAYSWPLPGWVDLPDWDSNPAVAPAGPFDTVNQGPNLGCPQPMTPMQGSKTTVKNAINAMIATGDTVISEGLVWGWRMLSPKWRFDSSGSTSAWEAGSDMAVHKLPLDYVPPYGKNDYSQKVVILMTDGWNQFLPFNYTSYGFLWDFAQTKIYAWWGLPGGLITEAQADDVLDKKTIAICNSMKAKGIIIYTIGFGVNSTDRTNPSSVNAPLLKECATHKDAADESHFFLAPTNADLQAAFTKIGTQLINLRVMQ